jgi:hypothetical protein
MVVSGHVVEERGCERGCPAGDVVDRYRVHDFGRTGHRGAVHFLGR